MEKVQEKAQLSATDAGAGKGDQPASNTDENVWDEERIERGLKIAKEMHIQVSDLRTTIRRLMEPLVTEQPSPETFLQNFSTSAKQAKEEVQKFRDLMTDAESKKFLEQAKKSRTDKPQGIKPWRATQHPDWLTRDT